MFFWRWPMKCHFISGQESKIWRQKVSVEERSRRGGEPTSGSEALSTSSLTCGAETSQSQPPPPRPPTFRPTHVVLSEVALALSVGLHHHVWRLGLADGHEARRHRRQRLRVREAASPWSGTELGATRP